MYIKRQIKQEFMKRSQVYLILALVGARQSGKTTFLKENGKDIPYITFDDPDVRKLFEEDIKKFEIQYMAGRKCSIFDEAHYCKDAGKNLKYLCDKGYKIWITSSSEAILKKEVLSYLVGRVSIMKLYPFSLKEFLDAKNIKSFNKDMLKRSVWEHIIYGGYPKVVLTEDIELKKTILRDLYDTMILKDIARTFSIEDVKSLEFFVRHISFNTGSILSYNKVTNLLNISFQTVKKYLDAMEMSHLIIRVLPFYRNKNREIIKQPKVYFVDTGLRNAIINDFKQDMDGFLFENYVLAELIKNGFNVKFWRTKSKDEVDFIIEKEKEIIPIEVKLKPTKWKAGSGLRSFIEEYKPKRAFIINYEGLNDKIKFSGCSIYFVDIMDLVKNHL